MAYLKLNGAELSVLVDSPPSMERDKLGLERMLFDGTWNKTIRATKRVWSGFETEPMSRDDAYAWLRFLDGDGHSWSFNAVSDFKYSSKGLPIQTGSPTRITAAPAPKFGAGALQIAAGAEATWATGLTGQWTLMVWKHDGAAWHHYIVRSDASKWVDGVSSGAANAFLTVDGDGDAHLGDTGAGANQHFDDFVALPFMVTSTMAAAFGTATVAFSSLPKLTATGDFIADSSLTVAGVNPKLLARPAFLSGSYAPTASAVMFDLREV